MNSPCHASAAQTVWYRAVDVGYSVITSTLRWLATMVHPGNVRPSIPCARRIVSVRPTQQARQSAVQSRSDGVVSFATGLDELERILDAHRRDRVRPEIQLNDAPRSNNSCAGRSDLPLELTGVWFKQGRRVGDVDLSRDPKGGWFEMYAEKTG